MARGIRHEVEPEVDSLSYIDFEDDEQGYWTALEAGGTDLEQWWVEAAHAFLGTAGVVSAGTVESDRLHLEYQTQGAAIFWDWVVEQALDAGFDVYDSDTRTELFPGGTLCSTEGECCAVAIALSAEHEDGEHADTRRGDCPLCEEAFEASEAFYRPEDWPEAELIDSERTYAVAVYETSREYGGPEEGGWWYSAGELRKVLSWQYSEDRAYERARAFNEAQQAAQPSWRRDGGLEARVVAIPRTEPDPDSYPCHDDPDAIQDVVRWDVPTEFPERAPHYC